MGDVANLYWFGCKRWQYIRKPVVVRSSNLSSRIVAPCNMAVALSTQQGRVDCRFSLPNGVTSSWFCIVGTGGRASVTIFWVKVVGVGGALSGGGYWVVVAIGFPVAGLVPGGSDWVGVYRVGCGRVGFPVAGQGVKSGWDVPGLWSRWVASCGPGSNWAVCTGSRLCRVSGCGPLG